MSKEQEPGTIWGCTRQGYCGIWTGKSNATGYCHQCGAKAERIDAQAKERAQERRRRGDAKEKECKLRVDSEDAPP
jgi:hypothetical protein